MSRPGDLGTQSGSLTRLTLQPTELQPHGDGPSLAFAQARDAFAALSAYLPPEAAIHLRLLHLGLLARLEELEERLSRLEGEQ